MNRYELAVEISEDYDFDPNGLNHISENRWVKNQYPVVYFLKNEETKVAYVGESTKGAERIRTHFANKLRRETLNKVSIIGSDKFNKSATLDIESQLIQYLFADQTYKLQNLNAGLSLHNYYQRDLYRELFKAIWSKLLERKITSRSLEEIENSAIFKYSPYKSLNADQYNSVIEILENLVQKDLNTIVVNGAAGTGKTILATYLMKLLVSPINTDQEAENNYEQRELNALRTFQNKYSQPKIALVIAMSSLRETLQTVFEGTPGLKASMVISPSQAVGGDYDILLVDEAHRLRQRKNISWMGAFDKKNAYLELHNSGTELDWIMKSSRNQVFFYDASQSVRPSDVSKEYFDTIYLNSKATWLQLKSQMRVIGGNDYISFVSHLLDGNPENLNEIELDKSYELLFFESFNDMHEQLRKREEIHKLSRLIAGYSWPWESKNKPTAIDIVIEGNEFQWNQKAVDWINSESSFQEIGCIHTTQGYDLNYGGVIFGKEITFNFETGQIEVIREHYFDKYGRQGATDEELKEYIVNIYKTIMYRGIRGTFVYACDLQMRAYLKAHLPLFRSDFPFRIIPQSDVKPYLNAVPVFDLKAAAGGFSDLQQPEILTWIELPNNITPRQGYFVSQVIGDSMLPLIPNGSWCLFIKDEGGSREGKVVLVQHHSIQDELGSGYTVKEYHSSKVQTEDGWRHETIVLKPKNASFEPIVLQENELEELSVVGIFHSILEP